MKTIQKDWDDLSQFTMEAKAFSMRDRALQLEGDLHEALEENKKLRSALLEAARELEYASCRMQSKADAEHFGGWATQTKEAAESGGNTQE